MTDKELYTALCLHRNDVPIFAHPWWLNCVCGGTNRWEVLLVRQDDQIIASMPYFMPARGIIVMPPYTKMLGIWFNPKFESSSDLREHYRRQTICEELIELLPSHNYFEQSFHYTFLDWLPFHWHGFRQTTRYTHVMPEVFDQDYLWNNLHRKRKKNITAAVEKHKLEVRTDVPVAHFMELNEETYFRQGLKPYCSDELERLIGESLRCGQGVIYGAYDRDNNLHAADFVVFQEGSAYCIAGGSVHEHRDSGGHILTLWQIVRDSSARSARVDFCGSMMRGIAGFFLEFGAIQTPYFVIEKGCMNIMTKIRLKIGRMTGSRLSVS